MFERGQFVVRNYRNQNGCWNCIYVFIYFDYDSSKDYYCNVNNNRPRCGSLLLNDEFDSYATDEIHRQQSNEWCNWSKNHQVDPCGICDNYK